MFIQLLRLNLLLIFIWFDSISVSAQKIQGDSSITISFIKKNKILNPICTKKESSFYRFLPNGFFNKNEATASRQNSEIHNYQKIIYKTLHPETLILHQTDLAQINATAFEYANFESTGMKDSISKIPIDILSKLTFNGYLSTYYALYTDSLAYGQYQKFPTTCPLNNSFSLNMIYLSAKYISNNYRGILSLHWGDIAESSWSPKYNFIQEANAGLKITKGLWLDAGFFRTHIGLESIQPRENIASSTSVVNHYETYFLSGVKLTYSIGSKFSIQGGIFNGFNSFVENNKSKGFGLSMVYTPSDRLSLTLNSMICDESPDVQKRKQLRVYNDFYLFYKSPKFDFGFEFNYGIQQNSKLSDSLKTAIVISSLLVGRYHFNKKFSIYLRGEYYDDRNEILTGPVYNEKNKLVGIHVWGITPGLQIAPIPNSYFRLEYRYLEMLQKDETIFYFNGTHRTFRHEFISSLGFWF